MAFWGQKNRQLDRLLAVVSEIETTMPLSDVCLVFFWKRFQPDDGKPDLGPWADADVATDRGLCFWARASQLR